MPQPLMMGAMPILSGLRRKLFPTNTERGPRQCEYGKNATYHVEPCPITVETGQGVMYGGQVFCSEAHAEADQEHSWP